MIKENEVLDKGINEQLGLKSNRIISVRLMGKLNFYIIDIIRLHLIPRTMNNKKYTT